MPTDSKRKPKFLRRRWYSYGKLGLKRKKKQKWRNPNGRDNKMREKRRGYLAVVSVGYGTDRKSKGTIKGKKPVRVENLNDLKKIKQNEIAHLGKIGQKMKVEIAKYAKQNKIEVQNLNVNKFMKKLEKKNGPK
ncbi:50S ribosomal protein L32e [uncultured archaeon]|nr:50S ribosomal protein L32e [uncultured archaeon]